MSIDEAIQSITEKIRAASAGVEIKAVKISAEEARLSVYAPAGDIQKIKEATFQPTLDLLNQEGLDVQVFVYDRDAPPLKG